MSLLSSLVACAMCSRLDGGEQLGTGAAFDENRCKPVQQHALLGVSVVPEFAVVNNDSCSPW